MIKCYYISVANLIWAISSVGQSSRLITGRSGVRVPDGPPNLRGIAQLVEQRSPKPRAEGSSPSAPAKTKRHLYGVFFVFARHNLYRGTRVPGIIAEAHPVGDEARRGWRSGQNLSALQAETNFGHRKRA